MRHYLASASVATEHQPLSCFSLAVFLKVVDFREKISNSVTDSNEGDRLVWSCTQRGIYSACTSEVLLWLYKNEMQIKMLRRVTTEDEGGKAINW